MDATTTADEWGPTPQDAETRSDELHDDALHALYDEPETQHEEPTQAPVATEPAPIEDIDPDDRADSDRLHAIETQALEHQAQQAQAYLTQLAGVIQAAEQRAASEQDSGQRARMRSDIDDAKREYKIMLKQAEIALKSGAERLTKREQARRTKRLEAEKRKLGEGFAERKDEIARDLRARGFTQAEISSISDARLAQLADDAAYGARMRKQQSGAPKAKYRVPGTAHKPRSKPTVETPPADETFSEMRYRLTGERDHAMNIYGMRSRKPKSPTRRPKSESPVDILYGSD